MHVTRSFFCRCPSSQNALIVIPHSTKYATYAIDHLKQIKELRESRVEIYKARMKMLEGLYELYNKNYPNCIEALMDEQKDLYDIDQEIIKRGGFEIQEIPISFEGNHYSKLSDNELKIAYEKILNKIEKLKSLECDERGFLGERTASGEKIVELEKTRCQIEQEMTRRGLRFSKTTKQKSENPSEIKRKISSFLLLLRIITVSAIAYMTFQICKGISELAPNLPSLDSEAKNLQLNNAIKFERKPSLSDHQVDPVKTESKMVNKQARQILNDLKREWIEIYNQADADAENGESSAFIGERIENQIKISLGKALLKLYGPEEIIKRVSS